MWGVAKHQKKRRGGKGVGGEKGGVSRGQKIKLRSFENSCDRNVRMGGSKKQGIFGELKNPG